MCGLIGLAYKMILKNFFTWWNRQTIGTFLKTLFTGKLVGKDKYGNKYYKNKDDKRWVIYSGHIEATKITSDWFFGYITLLIKLLKMMTKDTIGKKTI